MGWEVSGDLGEMAPGPHIRRTRDVERRRSLGVNESVGQIPISSTKERVYNVALITKMQLNVIDLLQVALRAWFEQSSRQLDVIINGGESGPVLRSR